MVYVCTASGYWVYIQKGMEKGCVVVGRDLGAFQKLMIWLQQMVKIFVYISRREGNWVENANMMSKIILLIAKNNELTLLILCGKGREPKVKKHTKTRILSEIGTEKRN